MDEGTKRKPRLNALPMDGVLAPYASDYNSELIQGRYAAATRHAYLCCIGHFACEFRRNPAGDSDLKPATVPI